MLTFYVSCEIDDSCTYLFRKPTPCHENDHILHLMKIHVKISENHKKGNKYLSSFWFSYYRSDFLSVLCFVSSSGISSVGHLLISVGQDWSKTYDPGNLWTSALVLSLGFV